MPARIKASATFHCNCFICLEEGPCNSSGVALGRDLPLSSHIAHQIRIREETTLATANQTALLEDISSSIFTTTAIGNDSPLDSHHSRLWSSREERQNLVRPIETSMDSPIDAILHGIGRLTLQSDTNASLPSTTIVDQPPSSNQEHKIHLSSRNTVTPADQASKKENNQRTKKAHLCLDKIEGRIRACSIRLDVPRMSQSDVVSLQEEVGRLRLSLANVRRDVHSVNVRRINITASLNGIFTHLEGLRKKDPINIVSALKYNSGVYFSVLIRTPLPMMHSLIPIDDHFRAPINGNDPIAQITMFIIVVCNVILGASRRMTNLILSLLSILLRNSFSSSEHLSDWQNDVLEQLPRTTESILKKFPLDCKTTIYAVCPACHCTYPPTFSPGSSTPIYPEQCSNIPSPESACTEKLLELAADGSQSPLKTFEYHSFHDYLATLLSRYDLEDVMDNACDNLMASIDLGEDTPTFISDIFDAQFIRTFRGPDGKHFVQRPGKEGRYLFVLNVDFFAAERQTIRGPSASCGLISAACLNLPLFIRYLPQNMYVAGIVPGPSEPKETQLNHYMRPVVDDFQVSWEHGVEYSRTAKYPDGRLTRSAIAVSVNDLPAARKVNQSIGHTSHKFCTRCHCQHRSKLDRTDVKHDDWLPKKVADLRRDAEAWRSAPTTSAQKKLLDETGMRWTELWRLPYWDPTCMLGVDSMHCLLEGVAQQHFREILRLTDVEAKETGPKEAAFEFDFSLPEEGWTGNSKGKTSTTNDRKHISDIHRILLAPLEDDAGDDIPDLDIAFQRLKNRLYSKSRTALNFVVSTNLSLKPSPQSGLEVQEVYSKKDCVEMLVDWVSF
jgi:hypothetical protein